MQIRLFFNSFWLELIVQVQASNVPVTEGFSHNVYLEFSGSQGYISVDGQKAQFSSSKSSDVFDLGEVLYVGGLGSEIDVALLPGAIWSAKLGLFYVGCVQDFVADGRQIDLMTAAKNQNRSDVEGYCKTVSSLFLSFFAVVLIIFFVISAIINSLFACNNEKLNQENKHQNISSCGHYKYLLTYFL